MNFEEERKKLVGKMINSGSLTSRNVIDAFLKVPREDFVVAEMKKYSYVDEPLPLVRGQTISQPSTVAIMTELLKPERGNKILEIGAGSGYQAAILSEIVGPEGKVITIEIVPELYDYARQRLEKYENVVIILGDGSLGYEKGAPYDRIIVTAASPGIPEPLKKQLKVGGRMVIPVGANVQEMIVVEKNDKGFQFFSAGDFFFVPLKGRYGFP